MITDLQIRELQDRLYQDPLFGHSRVVARALSDCYIALHFKNRASREIARERCQLLYEALDMDKKKGRI